MSKGFMRFGRYAVLAALWLGLLGPAAVTRAQDAAVAEEVPPSVEELARADEVSNAFRHVARTARPGVVHIRVEGGPAADADVEDQLDRLHRMLPQIPREQLRERLQEQPPGSGSGVIYDSQGHILTNNHVIAGRSLIEVTLADDRQYEAEVVGMDPKTDLAVIKIDAPDLKPLPLGDSDRMQVGDWVVAVGAPFGLTYTVTHGIVSATGRTEVRGVAIEYQDFIQTDAAINPGNSGGPLLNLRGEVIGINTAIATHGDGVNAGIAFTIPSNTARKIVGQLIESGKVVRGWLGISMTEVEAGDVPVFELPGKRGVVVERTIPDTPAAEAGLSIEDVILQVNGKPVTDSNSFRNLIADLPPGEQVSLVVMRDGHRREVELELGVQPDELPTVRGLVEAREIESLGIGVRTMRPMIARLFNRSEDARGVLVISKPRVIEGESQPADALEPGDLIVGANGQDVKTIGDLMDALKGPGEKTVSLELIDSEGVERTVYIRL